MLHISDIADLYGHSSWGVSVPHLALCVKSMTKMIKSQPSVVSLMVKSIGEYEDESIPCCQILGSLTMEEKTIHASSQTDGWLCLEWELRICFMVRSL